MAKTYEPIATFNGTGSSGTISFTSIPSTYTDLRVVMYVTTTNTTDYEIDMRYNNDSATNYSQTYLQGNGSSATSGRYSSVDKIRVGETAGTDDTVPSVLLVDIMNYANTTTYKTCLIRYNELQPSGGDLGAKVALWRSTSAINRVDMLNLGGNFTTITTATLYGIKAA
jgi:hypothetical protein